MDKKIYIRYCDMNTIRAIMMFALNSEKVIIAESMQKIFKESFKATKELDPEDWVNSFGSQDLCFDTETNILSYIDNLHKDIDGVDFNTFIDLIENLN